MSLLWRHYVFSILGVLILVLNYTSSAQAQILPDKAQTLSQGEVQAVAQNINAPRRAIIREDVPSLQSIQHVAAKHTHSGYPVPRYVSLKYGQVNGRRGPSTRHPILWEYQKRGLPLVVVAEMDIWRKVRDMNGDESWVRGSALSGEQTVIALQDIPLYAKPSATSNTLAVASQDALLWLLECRNDGWCQVKSDTGYKGWAEQGLLWGAEPL